MEVTSSDTPPPKKARSKARKDSVTTDAAPPKPQARKAAPKVKSTAKASALAELVTAQPSEHQLSRMIATAAYFIAVERQFSPGHELDDWLEAERRIRSGNFV
jgi:hypothetical protein